MTLTDIFNNYNNFLVKYISRMVYDNSLANDLAQETWMSIWTSNCELDWSNPARVLRMIARRRVIDYFRNGMERLPIKAISSEDYHTFWNDVAGREDKDEQLSDNVLRSLEKLSDGTRKCITMVLLDGYTHQEVAGLLDISVGTVLSRVHRGKAKLKRLLRTKVKI